MTLHQPSQSDGRRRIVLIGGGPSCVSVLCRLADQIAATHHGIGVGIGSGIARRPMGEVLLVDQQGETGGGRPHAAGVGSALLLNDSVAEIDATGIGLTMWLAGNTDRWLESLVVDPDPRVAGWLRRHATAIEMGRLGELFLPRTVFGAFMRARFDEASARLRSAGVAVVSLTARVSAVRPAASGGWQVEVAGSAGCFDADAVVLGVGAAALAPAVATHPRYFTREQTQQLPGVEPALHDALVGRPRVGRWIAVLGSSAAATEFLYALEGRADLIAEVDRIEVLSPSGRVADGLPTGRPVPRLCDHLRHLDSPGVPPPTSRELLDAVRADLRAARALGYTEMDVLGELDALFGAIFARMSATERREFVHRDSLSYRVAIRHTSPDYALAVRRLRAAGRLRVTAARVERVWADGAGELWCRWRGDGPSRAVNPDVVVDCRGFTGPAELSHPVVGSLVRAGTARVNESGRGLRVSHDFQAAPGLFVLGPLLAGTSQGADQIWFLENIARIYALADRVADRLATRLTGQPIEGVSACGIGPAVVAPSTAVSEPSWEAGVAG